MQANLYSSYICQVWIRGSVRLVSDCTTTVLRSLSDAWIVIIAHVDRCHPDPEAAGSIQHLVYTHIRTDRPPVTFASTSNNLCQRAHRQPHTATDDGGDVPAGWLVAAGRSIGPSYVVVRPSVSDETCSLLHLLPRELLACACIYVQYCCMHTPPVQ